MTVRWFGDPWPSEDERAPVCANDENKVDVPVGTKCLECVQLIAERDRGVVTACSPAIWGHWFLDGQPVCSYHLKCFLEEVVGGVMSSKILARMNRRPHAIPGEVPQFSEGTEEIDEDDLQPGRGWRSRET